MSASDTPKPTQILNGLRDLLHFRMFYACLGIEPGNPSNQLVQCLACFGASHESTSLA